MFFSLFSISVILAFLIYFFKTTDCTFNLWFWSKFGVEPAAYFRGKTVWVVGASSGIGEALCLRLSHFQCNIVLSARRERELERVAQTCRYNNKNCHTKVVPLDLLKFNEFDQKTEDATRCFGKLPDIVVLNSGVSQRSEWIEVEPQVDLDCFQINALGPTVLTRSILKKRSGTTPIQFVSVASIAGVMPAILSPSYSAAKRALIGYFETLALEYSSKGVSVSIVCPALTFSANNVFNAFTSTKDQKNGEVLKEITPAHMTAERCADLILQTTANDLHMTWFSKNPTILLLAYAYQVIPGLANKAIQFVGLDRVRRMRTGGKS